MTKSKHSKAELAAREKELIKKYKGKIVPNSIRVGTGKYEGKLTVRINTRGMDGKLNGKTLRIATSDLHQTNHDPKTAEALRRKRRNEKARAKRAEAAAKRAEAAAKLVTK